MVETTLQIVLRRHDSTRNVARYYVLAIEPSLYGEAALVRAWGRIGSLGRQRLDLYATTDAAGEALEVWLARKMRRGYAPVASEPSFGGLLNAAILDCG
jgi:predicted DNA-binding WGR domain protein